MITHGWYYLDWGQGTKINVIEVLKEEGRLIRIKYRVVNGKKDYTLWCNPESLSKVEIK
jgi:hypothetical protein